MGVLICPICKSRLEQEERRFACKNGHSFDLAAAGYLHLLPSNRMRAKIPGEGLAFQNIVWKDFEDDYVRQLEIKGFIVNNSGREVAVPVLRVDMLDKDTKSLQVLDQKPSVKTLQPGGRVAVSMIVKKPSPLTKYVYMTFIDKY